MGKSILRANGGAAIATLRLACALCTLTAAPAAAQKKAPEFTRQGLLIASFAPVEGSDFGLARKTGDAYQKTRLTPFAKKLFHWLYERARRP